MHIIPVIDIKAGIAVRAVKGDRANYRPLVSRLAPSPDPLVVAKAYVALYPFDTLYLADLDGIEGRGADTATQQRLLANWPGTEIWIDDGRSAMQATPRRRDVLGSELMHSAAPTLRRAVLSLDFRGDVLQGPPALLEDADLWPDQVIVMTLARVGSGEGPDLARLQGIVAKAGARKVYAAGGIRSIGDLEALREIGVSGALVASALHDGQIKTGDLEEIAG